MYNVDFLPIALADVEEIARYIGVELGNPEAAEQLAEEIFDSCSKLEEFPYLCQAYAPIRPLKHEYRKLIVQNYLIFYWVDEEKKQVTVARAIHEKMDFTKMLR